MTKLSARRRLAALCSLRVILADEAVTASGPALAADTPDRQWEDIFAVADELLVMSALSRALTPQAGLPEALRERLDDWRRGNTLRNARLREQLRDVIVALNQAETVPLLFKGSLHLMDGTLQGTGGRWMSDLDLLVPLDGFAAAQATLEAVGYVPSRSRPFEHLHELTFSRPGAPAPIDLHDALLGDERLAEALPTSEVWAHGAEVELDGGRIRVLSPTHQVVHNVLHATMQDLNHAVAGLPLRQLLALEDIVRAHGAAIDWGAVQARMERCGLARVLRDYLWLAGRYTQAVIPENLRDPAARAFELRVLIGFSLDWPPHLQRNLHYAFGRTYLESRYGQARGRAGLVRARVRHAFALIRNQPDRVRGQTVRRRI